jgi:16S rRNA (uracil1498-N3)-methyltransferase
MKPGDELIVFNGAGREAFGVLESYQGDSAVVRVLGDSAASTESSLDLTLAPCLAKGKKTDLVVEKAIELGVNRISVIISERSVGRLSPEAGLHRVERWRRIAISAAEQAGRVQVPVVERIQTLEELVATKPDDVLGLVFTAGAEPDPPATLRQRYPDTRRVVAIIGPEGGLSEEEIALARRHGFRDVGLGPRILRTETAAIVAAAICQHLWGDLGRRPPTPRSAI